MKLAPITLFVYNRLYHAQETVDALRKNNLSNESDLIIYSDGWKDEKDSIKVEKVREYLKTIDGFKSITIIERTRNGGLANSIIVGVTEVINKYGKIIVLEDDIITSRYFLEYMNRGLDLYENEDKVISIHSYIYPVKGILPETFLIKGADCQGWATWKRGWDIFESDGKKLLKEINDKKLTREFNFSDSFPYSKMLKAQTKGKNSSWAIRWYASAFLKNKLTLYPRESLVYNIGFDGSGTHGGSGCVFNKTNQVENMKVEINKIEIKENLVAKKTMIDFFKTIKEPLLKKIVRKMKEIFLPAKKY
jgi:hypothetical protein